MSDLGRVARDAINALPGADVSWRPDWDEAGEAAAGAVEAALRERLARDIEALRPNPPAIGDGAYNEALDRVLALVRGGGGA